MRKKFFDLRVFIYWLPALVWMGVIFYLSNKTNLSVGIGGPQEYLLRKLAHVCEFGVLASLFLFVFTKGYKVGDRKAFWSSLVLAIVFALSDEFHQTFVMGRNGNLFDVTIDSLGALLFLQLIALRFFSVHKKSLWLAILLNVAMLATLFFGMLQTISWEAIKVPQQVARHYNEIGNKELYMDDTDSQEEKKGDDIGTESGEIFEQVDLENKRTSISIPPSALLKVPFSSQAPFALWDEVHEEACEEMSLIMVKYYFDKKQLTPEKAEQEIQSLKEYQLSKNGHFIDSDMHELSEIAKDYFKLENSYVKKAVTKQDILKSLSLGSPVIVPTAGRLLGNPNFSGLGPLYHNLVIIGFDDESFITNDPGTKRGENYKYSFEVLMKAIHDFPGDKKEILNGEKNAIFFVKID